MNTTVIITLIICATIIAFVAIICNHCSENKITEANANCTLSKKIIRLHRNYIAGILGFAIIMLLTSKYAGPNNAIFEYLSFGSTITSLVLSILAIFVTVQSSTYVCNLLKDALRGLSAPAAWQTPRSFSYKS